MPGFVDPSAVETMVELELSDRAWVSDRFHTVYFEAADPSIGPGSPSGTDAAVGEEVHRLRTTSRPMPPFAASTSPTT
jgi:hypothetical protein